MKINYNGTQVEIEKNKNDNKERFSFLDNLYEIIYFFINTKYNTIQLFLKILTDMEKIYVSKQ